MLNDFRKAAADLRTAKGAEDIARLYLETIQNFTSDTMMIASTQTPKVQERLIAQAENELFTLGQDMLYQITQFDPRGIRVQTSHIQKLETLLDAQHELLSVRLNPNRQYVSMQDFNSYLHTARLVARNLDQMIDPTMGLDKHIRQEFVRLKSKLFASSKVLAQTHAQNKYKPKNKLS